MVKKLLISLVLGLVVFGSLGLYGAYQYRKEERLKRYETALNQKASQTSITLVEGWSNQQIGAYLEKNNVVSADNFLLAQSKFNTAAYDFLSSKPTKADLEGFIFPDTYFIPTTPPNGSNISDIIIKKALDNFDSKVTPPIRAQAQTHGLSLFQLITLASIIEKETGGNMDDKKTVAGIFYNRLHNGMPLQSDATIAFITGRANVNTQDTQTPSPYNTYLNTGLPAGPICNPSLNSILAAAYPNPTDYLYFLTDPATGRAIFATTYDQHLANKQKYLK